MVTSHTTFNFPTILTLIRLILSPLILPLLLVYLLPYNIFWLNSVLAGIFVLFGLTDFLDGYLARRLKQETTLGRVLDPIADKFLMYSTLIALLAVHKIYFYWVVIFIGREIFMMGLRQIALEHSLQIPVSWLGKLKTVAQIILVTIMIANPYQSLGVGQAFCWNGIEFIALLGSLMLSLISAFLYYKNFIRAYQKSLSIPQGMDNLDENME